MYEETSNKHNKSKPNLSNVWLAFSFVSLRCPLSPLLSKVKVFSLHFYRIKSHPQHNILRQCFHKNMHVLSRDSMSWSITKFQIDADADQRQVITTSWVSTLLGCYSLRFPWSRKHMNNVMISSFLFKVDRVSLGN